MTGGRRRLQTSNFSYRIGSSLEIPCTVRRSRVKYAYIRMKPGNLRLEVVIPLRSSLEIRAFLKSHDSWIRKKYTELTLVRNTIEKDRILIRGEEHTLEFRPSARRSHLTIADHTVTVEARNEDEAWQELIAWMRRESMKIVTSRIGACAARVGATYKKIFLRNSQIWGSCSTQKNLNFNWQLASLPEELAEYVVIHEVAHLKELNHSRRFWDVVGSLCPDYREREKRLKQYAVRKMVTTKGST